ncbi:helix-turn-helix domain-containing protein, partial [Streptomyces californicus]
SMTTLRPLGPIVTLTVSASLEELGALADPPLTKDAVAGRIRRLLAMADKRAQDLGIPGTESTLSEEMSEELADGLVG